MKVAELDGGLLDYWVLKSEGCDFELRGGKIARITIDGDVLMQGMAGATIALEDMLVRPSVMWRYGGPIIEREKIGILTLEEGVWRATDYQDRQPHAYGVGPTPLIAAMRCFVTSKFGEEVQENNA